MKHILHSWGPEISLAGCIHPGPFTSDKGDGLESRLVHSDIELLQVLKENWLAGPRYLIENIDFCLYRELLLLFHARYKGSRYRASAQRSRTFVFENKQVNALYRRPGPEKN